MSGDDRKCTSKFGLLMVLAIYTLIANILVIPEIRHDDGCLSVKFLVTVFIGSSTRVSCRRVSEIMIWP